MGLLTGQPRGATVVVEGDTECLRLDKVAFDKILRSRPEIVEALSQSLVRRQAENQALLQSLGQADRVDGDHGRARELMQRIRRFFALSAQQRPH
jgi:CRP-like cAMP-binding protein